MRADRWVKQDRFIGDPRGGNCAEAAVAAILGIPLASVPDFRAAGPDAQAYWSAFDDFLEQRGFWVLLYPTATYSPDCLYLASGPSARNCQHMVVMRRGLLVHDPHPSNAGLLSVEFVRLLVPMDPAETQPADHISSNGIPTPKICV